MVISYREKKSYRLSVIGYQEKPVNCEKQLSVNGYQLSGKDSYQL